VKRLHPAAVVVLAGISAALHIGKLPPALPVLREALDVSLVEAGFLLSLVQLAGMTLGLAMGAAADVIGARRTMVLGLLILSTASFAGGCATSAEALLALRALEGVGFLLTSLPAPGLIGRLVEPARLNAMLGLWGAYMPFGTAAALLVGPAWIAFTGWPGWWWSQAVLSTVMAALVWVSVPAWVDEQQQSGSRRTGIAETVRSPGPWLASLAFAVYSGQWLTVVGFLPTIYAQAGLPVAYAAIATATAAAVNMAGNIGAGRLLQRGAPAPLLMQCGYLAMGAGAVLAFAPGPQGPWLRYAGVLLFSTVGGLVPGTLFALSVRVAPDARAVSTTVGFMQQCSSLGQFAGPPVAAWAAARAGGWHVIWWITGSFALVGMVITAALARFLARQQRAGPSSATGPVESTPP
jgi:CP family cyanate transporter-like MFS transporter